jgi:hypothetical protein
MNVKGRIKMLRIEGEGPAALDALRKFVENGQAAQRAVDELGAGAPKRVPSGEGGKPLGMERPKRPRRNRSI